MGRDYFYLFCYEFCQVLAITSPYFQLLIGERSMFANSQSPTNSGLSTTGATTSFDHSLSMSIETIPREKLPILDGLCPPAQFENNANCFCCQTKIKDRTNCEFCGKSICKACVAKKRRNPKTLDKFHKICRRCEMTYLTMQLHEDLQKERQSKQGQLFHEEANLETMRELLFSLKNNIDRESSQHQEKTKQLLSQEQEAQAQVESLQAQIEHARMDLESYRGKVEQENDESTNIQIELNAVLHNVNHAQFEVQRIQKLIEATEEQIADVQFKLENNLKEEGGNQNESNSGVGYDSIFRESSQHNLDGKQSLGVKRIGRGSSIMPPKLEHENNKECVMF